MNQSQQQFEQFGLSAAGGLGKGHLVKGEDGEYLNFATQCYWDFWQASRAAVVVELPDGRCLFDRSSGRAPGGLPLIELKQAADAIEAVGLKYEVKP